MTDILLQPYADALARTLVHFVWEGAAIGLMAFVLIRFSGLSAFARYVVGVGALAAMLIAPVVTFVMVARLTPQAQVAGSPSFAVTSGVAASVAAVPSARISDAASAAASRPTPPSFGASVIILALWGSGVLVLSLRLLGGWVVARRVAVRAIQPAAPEIQAIARRLADQLGLDRVVRVVVSSAVAVPVLIGWLKPVVLLPAAALAGLTVDQVEAVLAHELAHVRRHDYLVNLLQSVVETLLFYHPAVWWVSRSIRVDREDCCDDVALGLCDRVVYATALTELAAIAAPTRVALAATDGSLVHRVRRILGRPVTDRQPAPGWFFALVVVLVAGSIAATQTRIPVPAPQAPVVQPAAPSTPPEAPSTPLAAPQAPVEAKVRAEPPVQTQAQAAAEEIRKLEQEAATRSRQIQDERRQIDGERAANEFRKAQTQSQARLQELEVHLEALRKLYEQNKSQLAAGSTNIAALSDLQAQMQSIEQKMRAEKAELQYLMSDFELRRREVALARESSTSDEAQVKLQRLVEQQLQMEAARNQAENRDQVALARLGAESIPAAAADAKVQPRDVLVVVVSGEPDLPRTFVVQTDGSIRFPLVGSIKVQGLTAGQVREAIGKQLSDRHLASGAALDVTLRRPR